MSPSPSAELADIAEVGPTISAVEDRYKRALRARNLRPATISMYLSALHLFDEFLAEQGMPRHLRAIRREHIEAFLEWCQQRPGRRGEKASQAWVALQHNSLLPFWKWAVDRDEIDRSPMEKVRPPLKDEVVKPALSPDELQALLATTRGRQFDQRRDRAILLLLLDTGIRRGELAGLRVQDVDFKTGTVEIRAEVSKSRRVRVVPVSDTTLDAIDSYLSVRGSHDKAADTDALWLGVRKGPGGKPPRRRDSDEESDPVPPYGMRGDGIRQMIDRRARQAGLPGAIGVHIFRRTMAHSFLAAGGSEIDLQTIGGWKDRGMVQHYSRALEADRAQAAHRRFSPVDALLKR